MATVLVVDPSRSVRETLRIVLGHEHAVAVGPSLGERPTSPTPEVLVLGLPPPPRNERAVGATLARELPNVPLLLLHGPRDVDLGTLAPPHVPIELLPKPFDAYAIRARVRALLAAELRDPGSAERRTAERRRLEFPFVSEAAAAVLRRAASIDVPIVLVQGESGTGVGSVARALHVARGRRGPLLQVDAAALVQGELARRLAGAGPGVGTLLVTSLDRASSDGQADLLRVIEDGNAGGAVPPLVVTAARDLGELASTGALLPELAYAAGTLPVVLAPLRDRVADLPALVEMLTRDACARMRLPPVTYHPDALARLQSYLWFGNVAELEAVLTRTLALHRAPSVAADQLVFLPEATADALTVRTSPPPHATGPATTTEAANPALAGLDLEVVLGELAHELRNPMVTIKTVAQHLDAIAGDPEARARFSVLMGEAVGRMDGVLESLLDFARFRAPSLQPLAPLVDRVLGEHAEELARRHVHVERNGSGLGSVHADESQMLFALRSLCRGLVTNLVPHSALWVRGVAPGTLELQVQADPSVAARLASWVEPRVNASDTPPLAWALAAALVERNGGTLTVEKGRGDATVIRIAWAPPAA